MAAGTALRRLRQCATARFGARHVSSVTWTVGGAGERRLCRRPVASPAAGTPIPALELIDVVIVPRGDMTVPRARAFGSLSGLARDERTGRYVAVIDDRLPARVAWLDIKYVDGRLSVVPLGVEPVTAGPGVDPRIAVQADLEAVVGAARRHVRRQRGRSRFQGRGGPAAGRLLAGGAVDAVAADDASPPVHPWPAAFSGRIRRVAASATTRAPRR